MTDSNRFYVYAYLREDGTPYYIGKGTGDRINNKARTFCPPPVERRVKLLWGVSEAVAFRFEIQSILYWGTKYDGTGILRNLTKGGEGHSNPSEETRNAIAAGRTKENQQAVADIKKRNQAQKMNVPVDVYFALTRLERMTLQKRYCRGIRGKELWDSGKRKRSPSTGQALQRLYAAADKYGVSSGFYIALSTSNRRLIQSRFRRGKRGTELTAGLVPA